MQIDEGAYKRLPPHLQALFERLPNPSSDEVLERMPEAGNGWKRNYGEEDYKGRQYKGGVFAGGGFLGNSTYTDSGSAARFFYCAKASKADRDEGLGGMPRAAVHRYGAGIGEGLHPEAPAHDRNHHPTVKPTALMRYLCRLVTPPGGVVLDPFMGSGSTGKAAVLEGFDFVGIELDAEYLEIARLRIAKAQEQPPLWGLR